MRIRIVTLVSVALVLVAAPAMALDFLAGYCLFVPDVTDRSLIAAGRAACDQIAETAGYAHGVFRPATDEELALFLPCESTSPPSLMYSCLGAPPK